MQSVAAALLLACLVSPRASAVMVALGLEQTHDPAALAPANADGAGFLALPMIMELGGGVTTAMISSASGNFQGGLSEASSTVFDTFDQLHGTLASDQWTLTLDAGLSTEARYLFRIDVSALQEAHLPPTRITYPANGLTGVSPNPTFHWTGPTTFETLNAFVLSGPVFESKALAPAVDTSWSPSKTLIPGSSSYARVFYTRPDSGQVLLQHPQDAEGIPLAEWSYSVELRSDSLSHFAVAAVPEPAAMPLAVGAVLLATVAWRWRRVGKVDRTKVTLARFEATRK